jgi:hypothetical protein
MGQRRLWFRRRWQGSSRLARTNGKGGRGGCSRRAPCEKKGGARRNCGLVAIGAFQRWGGGVWGRRHTTGLGEGTRCSMAVAAGPLEPDRGGNGQAAHARVAGTKTGEVGLPSGAPLQSRAARSNGLNHFQIQTFKMFKFFQTLTDQKIISLNYKNWK